MGNHVLHMPAVAVERRPRRDVHTPEVNVREVFLMFTSVNDTIAAVPVARDLARRMNAPLTLIHFRTVPFRWPLDRPPGISPVETETFERAVDAVAYGARIRVVLCRDEPRAALAGLDPHSVIVVPGRRHWWPTMFERRIRALEDAGHRVMCVANRPVQEASRA